MDFFLSLTRVLSNVLSMYFKAIIGLAFYVFLIKVIKSSL